jgi:hypothetical protein
MPIHNDLLWQLLSQVLLVVVLVFAVVAVLAGAGLIVSTQRTLRFFGVMNRWISTRGALKAMEIPRSTEAISHRNPRLLGWALIAGDARQTPAH